MKNAALVVVILAFLRPLAAADKPPAVRVEFCELLAHPRSYNGKRVTIRATYRYGFEWSQLYCMNCNAKGLVWFDYAKGSAEADQEALRNAPKREGTVNATFTGTFETHGPFGHMNGYDYRFLAELIENVEVVSKSSVLPQYLKPKERARVCGGTVPR